MVQLENCDVKGDFTEDFYGRFYGRSLYVD